jgi:hypothetical protein
LEGQAAGKLAGWKVKNFITKKRKWDFGCSGFNVWRFGVLEVGRLEGSEVFESVEFIEFVEVAAFAEFVELAEMVA